MLLLADTLMGTSFVALISRRLTSSMSCGVSGSGFGTFGPAGCAPAARLAAWAAARAANSDFSNSWKSARASTGTWDSGNGPFGSGPGTPERGTPSTHSGEGCDFYPLHFLD